MPDIASDAPGRSSGRRRPRLTLRLRLTLLYGACFIVAGAALLAITYGLVADVQTSTHGSLRVQGVSTSPGRSGTIVTTGPAGGTPGPGIGQLQTAGAQQLSAVVQQAQVAIDQQRAQTLSALLTQSGVALAIMAVLSIGVGYVLAGRTLAPLRTMNERARAITENSLHERLAVGTRSDELGDLAASFDALLGRLQRAFEAQRQFVANASHELRTPVTFERTLVEVALADPDASVHSLRTACERVLGATARQEQIIEALLVLARSQAGAVDHEPIDLAALLRAELSTRDLPGAGIEVRTRLAPAPVRGDRRLLERMVANLLDNAAGHNRPSGAWIEIATQATGARAQLTIANGGAVIDPDHVADLFEPFRRLHGARTHDGGLGLGLSIVRAIAVAHGGDVQAQALPEGGLRVHVQFAASLPAPEHATGAAPVRSS